MASPVPTGNENPYTLIRKNHSFNAVVDDLTHFWDALSLEGIARKYGDYLLSVKVKKSFPPPEILQRRRGVGEEVAAMCVLERGDVVLDHAAQAHHANRMCAEACLALALECNH